MEHSALLSQLADNIEKVLVGKRGAVELAVAALACGGHLLIEDVPGVGKTSLASAMARSLAMSFRRIQFTPDILPSDITGFSVFNPGTHMFEFREGAIMAHVVLADEINRGTPKTQSSLLEAMEEGQITVDGVTHALPNPFFVVATQNPTEYLGTYPLPEAQLDRFFLRITLGYPSPSDEVSVLDRYKEERPMDKLAPVASPEALKSVQEAVRKIHVDGQLRQYIVELVNATRGHTDIALGASPRASLSLMRGAQAWALMQGRDYVLPDDIKHMAPAVLSHRLVLRQEARIRRISADDLIYGFLSQVRIPVVKMHD